MSTQLPEEPGLVQIDTWQGAELNAAAWMRFWGYRDARCTRAGSDGGIDITSSRALGQVKFEAASVGTPTLQRLVGARGRQHHKELFFFSGAGYASRAVEYAEDMDVALFKYDLLGRMTAVSSTARSVVKAVSANQPGVPYIASRSATTVSYGPDGHPAAKKRQQGRGWLGRNWVAIFAVYFTGQPLVLLPGLIAKTGKHQWEDLLIGAIVAPLLWAIWVRSHDKRQRWKRKRDGTWTPNVSNDGAPADGEPDAPTGRR